MTNILQTIQQAQFSDKPQAEALLITFIRETFDLSVQSVELRPLATSLNSFNGFITLTDGKKLFFKTHTEQDTVIDEYYNARLLADVGYPIIQPLYSTTKTGQQFLIYEVITSPSVFDVAWDLELRQARGDNSFLAEYNTLKQAQNNADDALFTYYQNTLEAPTPTPDAPIHQLFYHRLTGGRYDRFYADDTPIILPHGTFRMGDVKRVKWVINGQAYGETINDLVADAIRLLNPAIPRPTIIGHGDAHNGNVFFLQDEPSLLYFDPAFAGRHPPLFDLAKPIFHNVFAMWMYYPQVKKETTPIHVDVQDDTWHITYSYPLWSVRMMFLESKFERVLIPTIKMAKERGFLPDDWQKILRLALFCCPFLTLNLADANRFPPEISLLGLAMSVEMGGMSDKNNDVLADWLNKAQSVLA
ncbi:MAG: phosphotransferase [bacterium]|nr:phosphotransferase [bacterium]